MSVSVSVLAAGVPVAGLSSSDFELLDDGVPQKIGAVSVESQPVDVSLLLDLSGSVARPAPSAAEVECRRDVAVCSGERIGCG